MPLTLKGKSKSRLDIQWDGCPPGQFNIVIVDNEEVVLYHKDVQETSARLQIELNELALEPFSEATELELVSILQPYNGSHPIRSETIVIQKCHHAGCSQWGHVREDGYCKHCGRRIRDQSYTHGFRKLELGDLSIVLWNNEEGRLWKEKECREDDAGIYSRGRYEDKIRYRDEVEIIEEKFDPVLEKNFLNLHELLDQAGLLDCFWKPPLAVFQENEQRTIWIYYPRVDKKSKWRSISALSYIVSKNNVDLIEPEDIVQVGIQLCTIARKIRQYGHIWGGVKLRDLILCRDQNQTVSIYLRSKNITWHGAPKKNLLDTCLMPWELFWENSNNDPNITYETTEIYIIAAIMYLLASRATNLLSYNSLSYPYGLPPLALFNNPIGTEPSTNEVRDHLESVLNPALILDPQERGYRTLQEFQTALEYLYHAHDEGWVNTSYTLDVGCGLDVGYEKNEEDFSENQDAAFITTASLRRKQWGMFILCDGISTATIGSGDLASKAVVSVFRDWWKNHDEDKRKQVCTYASQNPEKGKQFLSNLIDQANAKIAKEVAQLASPEVLQHALIMGTTVTAGLISEGTLLFCWLGDSPIYRISSLGWQRLNYEDNERNSRILAGMPLEECVAEGGDSLTRCVGANFCEQQSLDLHFGYTSLYASEQILICSDGIPDFIEQEPTFAHHENYQMLRITAILNQYQKDVLLDAKALAHILIATVNRVGGGYDNLSAILLHTPAIEPSSALCYQQLRSLSSNIKLPNIFNHHSRETKSMSLIQKIEL